jgi:hypothetical protein
MPLIKFFFKYEPMPGHKAKKPAHHINRIDTEIKREAKTFEQKLAFIQSLQSSTQRRIRNINRPLAMAATAVIVPTTFWLLFLQRWSPFYSVYNEHYRSGELHYQTEVSRLVEEKVIAEHITPKKAIADGEMQFMTNAVLTLRGEPDIDDNASLDAILGKFDIDPTYKERARVLKTRLINFANRNFIKFENVDTRIFEPFAEDINKYTVKELFHLVEKRIEDFFAFAKRAIYQQVQPQVKKITTLVINTNITTIKIVFSMLAQYFLIGPWIAKKFPHGVFQAQPPKVDCLPSTNEEADALIASLREHDAVLEQVERRNAKYARIASAAVVGGALYDLTGLTNLLTFGGLLSPELVIIFFIGLIATGSVNLLKDLYGLYEWYTFETVFERQQAHLKVVLGKNAYELTSVKRENLESSRFVLQFNKQRGDELSPDKLARIIKNIFACNGVKASLRKGQILIIPADCPLNSHYFRRLFAEGIKREQAIIELKKQVKQLLRAYAIDDTALLFMPSITKRGLPNVTIEFNLPLAAKKYHQQFIGLFAENEIDIEEKENFFNIRIKGGACVDQAQFKNFLNQLQLNAREEAEKNNSAKRDEKYAESPSSADTLASRDEKRSSGLQREATPRKEPKPTVDKLPARIPTIFHRRVQWGDNAVYDSKSEKNTIYTRSV